MDYRRKTEELNSITIERVATLLGVALSGRNTSHCPFNDHDDKTPSFTIFNSNTRWKCFGCGRSGGAIDLAKCYLGLSFVEAKKWLLDHSGNGTPIAPSRLGKKNPFFLLQSSIPLKKCFQMFMLLLFKHAPYLKVECPIFNLEV